MRTWKSRTAGGVLLLCMLTALPGADLFRITASAENEGLEISQIVQRGRDVYLYVNVLDESGAPAEGPFTAEQFSVSIGKDGTVPVKMPVKDASVFSATGQGVTYIFCVDVTRSVTEEAMQEIKGSISRFVSGMTENDYAQIILFGRKITPVCDYTQDKAELNSMLRKIRRTADYNSNLCKGLSSVMNSLRGKKTGAKTDRAAVILFTDGTDASDSTAGVQQVLADAAVTKIPVYVVGMKGYDSKADLSQIEEIAVKSGGKMLSHLDQSVAAAVRKFDGMMDETYCLQVQPESDRFGYQNLVWNAECDLGDSSASSADYMFSLDRNEMQRDTEAPAETETPTETPIETEAPTGTETSTEAPEQTETLTEAPIQTEALTETPAQTETPTEVSVETEASTEEPEQTEPLTEAPIQTEAPTETPEQTETQTEAPAETEAPTEEPEQTEPQTGAPVETEAPTETLEQTEAPTETETPALIEPSEQTEAPIQTETPVEPEPPTEAPTEAETPTEPPTEAPTETELPTEPPTEPPTEKPVPTTRMLGQLERPSEGDSVEAELKIKGWVLVNDTVGNIAVFADLVKDGAVGESFQLDQKALGESTFEKRRKKYEEEIAAAAGYELRGSYSIDSLPAGSYDLLLRAVDEAGGQEEILQTVPVTVAGASTGGGKDVMDFLGLTEETEERNTHYDFAEKGFSIGLDVEAENPVISGSPEQVLMTGWLNAEPGTSLGMFLEIDGELFTADALAERGGEFTILRTPRYLENMDAALIGTPVRDMEEAGFIINLRMPFLGAGDHTVAVSFNVGVPGAEPETVDMQPVTIRIDSSSAYSDGESTRIADAWESEFPRPQTEEEETELETEE